MRHRSHDACMVSISRCRGDSMASSVFGATLRMIPAVLHADPSNHEETNDESYDESSHDANQRNEQESKL